jgi:hypothetical protein
MPGTVTTCRVERRTDLNGKTLYFMIRSGSRSRSHKFFAPYAVPAFEGAEAWFTVQRDRWGDIKFLARVESR